MTDGQTDGIAIAYARLAYMLPRAKKIDVEFRCFAVQHYRAYNIAITVQL